MTDKIEDNASELHAVGMPQGADQLGHKGERCLEQYRCLPHAVWPHCILAMPHRASTGQYLSPRHASPRSLPGSSSRVCSHAESKSASVTKFVTGHPVHALIHCTVPPPAAACIPYGGRAGGGQHAQHAEKLMASYTHHAHSPPALSLNCTLRRPRVLGRERRGLRRLHPHRGSSRRLQEGARGR